ncbi:GIY-YIG nuclease family protein [Bacillus mycoides]|uniref:GIY-YIG nuclease family protein n=1 Tax=Bacillus mycoides TaxID=1405 RepID=UPI001C01B4A2|nr:GIY-YIG nuclease family protein [Bacillus mycoides]QWI10074.1 hypothetical protein EXW47_06520 [Bacillus mycoides]
MSIWKREVKYKRTDLYVWERKILKHIKESGVYVFRDKDDNIIYIGEAYNLATRVGDHISGNSALLKDYAFSYTYKVELYRLNPEDRHIRKLMEIDAIQRISPVFNTKHRIDGTAKMRSQKRKNYLSNGKTWKTWTNWQVLAYLEGAVLSDVVLMQVHEDSHDSHDVDKYVDPSTWESSKRDILIKKIMKKRGYKKTEELIEKVFSFGIGQTSDKNAISPINNIALIPFDVKFKRRYDVSQRIINMINRKKDMGTKLSPTTREEGDPHKESTILSFS